MGSKISKVVQETKSKSNVDNFTVNIEKAIQELVGDIIEEVRFYGVDSVCDFKQEEMANYLTKKYIRD
jgi:hypothetical protein